MDVIGSVALVTLADRGGVSLTINTNYLSPIPIGQVVEIESTVVKVSRLAGCDKLAVVGKHGGNLLLPPLTPPCAQVGKQVGTPLASGQPLRLVAQSVSCHNTLRTLRRCISLPQVGKQVGTALVQLSVAGATAAHGTHVKALVSTGGGGGVETARERSCQ